MKSSRKQYRKQYYQKNQERIKQKSKEYRLANLETVRKKMREVSKERRELNPELAKTRARGYSLQRKYGITLEQYDELLAKQNYCCAICERHESEFKTKLAVDHNHATSEIRGLLCTHCNYRMVAKHKDGNLLRKIADYIEQGTGWLVPKKARKKVKRKPSD